MNEFTYEGAIGTTVEEGGFAASDIVLIGDRSDAIGQEPALLTPGGDQGSWWEGKSLYKIIDELGKDFPKDDGDTIIPKVKLTIEVIK